MQLKYGTERVRLGSTWATILDSSSLESSPRKTFRNLSIGLALFQRFSIEFKDQKTDSTGVRFLKSNRYKSKRQKLCQTTLVSIAITVVDQHK